MTKADRVAYYREYRRQHPEKIREYRKRYEEKHRERRRTIDLRYHLKSAFGMSLEDYERRLEEQGGACAICRRIPRRRLDVDHAHDTGRVRGLLCNPCNRALALFREDPGALREAIGYLSE